MYKVVIQRQTWQFKKIDGLKNFLRQPLGKRVGFDEGLKELGVLFS